jgi:DNA-binding response OmpR family regulator
VAKAKASILWVDDEIDLLKSQIMFLEERGYSVTPVSNGEDAVGLVMNETYDLVLLDQMMPGLDGLSTLVKIKEINPSLPVVMITKMEEEELIDEALRKRIDDFLLKPVNPVQILSAARRILEGKGIRETELSREFVDDFNAIEMLKSKAEDWRDWLRIHVKLSEWDVLLDEFPDSGLMQSHLDQRRQCNVEFSMYVEKAYRGWTRDGEKPLLSVDVVASFVAQHLSAARKVYFVIIDCLRLDQWLAIEPMLEPYFSIKRDYYYSILPTATPYSRNAIFAGLFPSEIAEKYPDYWDETGSDESGKNRFERQLLDKQLKKMGLNVSPSPKYLKIYTADEAVQVRKQIPTLRNVPLVSLVFNFVDIVAHSRSESVVLQEMLPDESAYRSFTKSWFMHSPLFDMLKSISLQDAIVVLTTDHGSVLGRRSAVALGDRETSTNVRYKFGTNLNCDERQAIRLKDPLDYKLPRGGVNKNYIIAKEDYYFVYPTNFHEYERHYKHSFQHGGVSMEEMILPCVTMKPKR